MNYIKNIYSLFAKFLILAICFSSCKATKQQSNITSADGKSQTGLLSAQDEANFASFFVDGCKERMKGNLEIAENLFKQCLKINPNSIPVKYELGMIYKFNGLFDTAIKYAKECASADFKNEWYQLLYIECLHNKGQYLQAAEVYAKLTKNFPKRSEFYEGLAAEYMYAGNYEKSFKTYDELEKKFGQNESFTLNKVKLLKELKRMPEAEQELKNLVQSNPNEVLYHSYLADFYQETNQNDKAMDTYKDILKIDPKNPMVHLALADYYKSINDKDNFYKEVKIAFENPDLDPNTKLKILISYYQLTENNNDLRTQADELLKIMLEVHPNTPEAHSINADFLFRDKRIKEARDEYALAAKLDKNKFAIWNQLMYVDSELNDYTTLESHSSEAIELFPNQAIPYFFNGIANIQTKNYTKAVESLKDGLEFVVDNNPLLIQFYANLGDAYNYLKAYEKSDKAFDDALKVDPDNTYILNNYAYFLSLRKTNLDKAEKYSKRCNELAPNNRSYIDTYGWILYQLGKYKDAEEWLARAVKMGTKNAVILEHYGDVLYKLNKPDEALKLWQEAKQAGFGTELLDKKIADKKLHE